MTNPDSPGNARFIRWFETLGSGDTAVVGGKNASLGEMIQNLASQGVRVPGGFATTVDAYWHYLDHNNLRERVAAELQDIDVESKDLHTRGRRIREMIEGGEMPPDMAAQVLEAFTLLQHRIPGGKPSVAVRSSATAEDLPGASFAGQQETFLNISTPEGLIEACKGCLASLFTDRAIAYREARGFDHMKVGLSIGVQQMVDASDAAAGVMFSIATETGFPDVVVINAAWGIGELVVKGSISPDEYLVFKPVLEMAADPVLRRACGTKEQKMVFGKGAKEPTRVVDTPASDRGRFALSDDEIRQLSRWAVAIEQHYGMAMDMEWAKDGITGDLYIVQARPETVQSLAAAGVVVRYSMGETPEPLLTGAAIGGAVAAGRARVLKDISVAGDFEEGDILVTGMTSPDWVPVMKRAAAIVTDHGGRTSHAAIVSRELGVPAVIGTGEATKTLRDGSDITVSCARGNTGYVYEGRLPFEREEIDPGDLPECDTEIMMNIASPDGALQWWRLPFDGIGLARMEFIINNHVGVHPMALIHPDRVEKADRDRIAELTRGHEEPTDFFVDRLAEGVAIIAASIYPKPAIVRLSDFKTNEYADLLGGRAFEPEEENPMLGFRGASRYVHPNYRAGFALECRAMRKVREDHGLENVALMIPFCRSPREADQVIEELAANGLVRGKRGLELYMMVEVPSNVVLAADFATRFDGFSIGSNDLTQMILGISRDSPLLQEEFDERDPAVKAMVRQLIETARQHRVKVGICGQAPSDYPEFAEFLVECGIDSISVNPDSAVDVWHTVAATERRLAATRERAAG